MTDFVLPPSPQLSVGKGGTDAQGQVGCDEPTTWKMASREP